MPSPNVARATVAAFGVALISMAACGGGHDDDADDSSDAADGSDESSMLGGDGSGPTDARADHASDTGTSGHDAAFDARGTVDASGDLARVYLQLAHHDNAGLDSAIAAIYDPASASYRQYLSPATLAAQYEPTQTDVNTTTAWLTSQGLTVARVATNRLLLEVHGTVAAIGAAFQAPLAVAIGGDSYYVFIKTPVIPASLASVITSVLSPDSLAATGGPPSDKGVATNTGPANPSASFLVKDIAGAYGATTLMAGGSQGAGVSIGIVGTGGGRPSDLKTFWMAQGITRTDPVVVTVAEPPTAWSTEATLDLQWAGGMAPAANVVFYGAPDNQDGSLLFAMNEAVGRAEVDIVTNSFAHHEVALPQNVRATYGVIGRFAAAMGMTMLAASGDSGAVDFPGSSPWWTSVGGTTLTLAGDGSIANEVTWPQSGCGLSTYEAAPAWQSGIVPGANGKRGVVDLSAHANSYFTVHIGAWQILGGTSFASPVVAGLIALIDSARITAGMPKLGFLNPALYGSAAVQGALRDVTSGASGANAAAAGWDFPTGWGSPNAAALATAWP